MKFFYSMVACDADSILTSRPSWKGQPGVHVHMTNTGITDPESLEKRYLCILREFSIRKCSEAKESILAATAASAISNSVVRLRCPFRLRDEAWRRQESIAVALGPEEKMLGYETTSSAPVRFSSEERTCA